MLFVLSFTQLKPFREWRWNVGRETRFIVARLFVNHENRIQQPVYPFRIQHVRAATHNTGMQSCQNRKIRHGDREQQYVQIVRDLRESRPHALSRFAVAVDFGRKTGHHSSRQQRTLHKRKQIIQRLFCVAEIGIRIFGLERRCRQSMQIYFQSAEPSQKGDIRRRIRAIRPALPGNLAQGQGEQGAIR